MSWIAVVGLVVLGCTQPVDSDVRCEASDLASCGAGYEAFCAGGFDPARPGYTFDGTTRPACDNGMPVCVGGEAPRCEPDTFPRCDLTASPFRCGAEDSTGSAGGPIVVCASGSVSYIHGELATMTFTCDGDCRTLRGESIESGVVYGGPDRPLNLYAECRPGLSTVEYDNYCQSGLIPTCVWPN